MKRRNQSINLLTSILLSLVLTAVHVSAKKAGAKAKIDAVVPVTRELSAGENALAGAFATAVGVTLMHPIDTIKTLQQSDMGIGLSMLGASKKIVQDGGVASFYSGLGPYVTSDAMAGGIKFATYEVLKKWVKDKIPEEHQGSAVFVCAAAAFLASSIVLVPGELLKQRLQMGQIASTMQGIPQIIKSDGFFGLYAGYSGVCIRDIPYTMLELGIYDNLKDFYLKMKNRKSSANGGTSAITQLDEIITAAISGGITAYLTSPLDTIKTKLMVETGYNGFFDCVAKSIKENGVASLFNGSVARVAWLLPFTAFYLPVYEITKRKLRDRHVPSQAALGVQGGSFERKNQPHNWIMGGRQPTCFSKRKSKPSTRTRYETSVCF